VFLQGYIHLIAARRPENIHETKNAQNLEAMAKNENPATRPPKTLSKEAATLWKHYAAELDNRQMFIEADHAALHRLCVLEVQAGKLTQQIETEGVLQQDRDGTTRRNPALMALSNLSQIIESLKRSLSLGGYYRHRIGEERKEEKPRSTLMQYRRNPAEGNVFEHLRSKTRDGSQ
jgi:P27 family predicted phage terminase small subunit